MDAVLVGNFAVMPRGDIVRAQLFRLFEEGPELDFPIAQYVGVGRSARLVLGEEIGEYSIHILLGEVDRIIGDIDQGAHATDVGVVLLGGTAPVLVVFFPVEHEQPDDVITLLFQKQSGNGAIHTAAHADDDCFRHKSTRYPSLKRGTDKKIL